jgi:hypothetical protein
MPLSSIRVDPTIQARNGIRSDVIDEYAEALRGGAIFPPVTAFDDGGVKWLSDGFHRHAAHAQAGRETIAVDVRQGTRRDAILHAASANAAHGLQRSPEDKRRAAMALLSDQEWSKWSDREIARRCSVSHAFIRNLRSLTGNVASERTYITRHGATATMRLPPPHGYPVLCADPAAADGLTLAEIETMPVGDIATDQAVLYLWAQPDSVPACLRIVAAWGFKYRTSMVVLFKDEPYGSDEFPLWRHEVLLIACRREFPTPKPEDRVGSVVVAPDRSVKHAVVAELIDRWYPDLSKIGVFLPCSVRQGWWNLPSASAP